MEENDNFLAYLRSLNPPVRRDEFGKKLKSFQFLNIKGIEEYLELPHLLIHKYIQGEKYRTLGVHREKVITFFKTLGYNEGENYGQFL